MLKFEGVNEGKSVDIHSWMYIITGGGELLQQIPVFRINLYDIYIDI